MCILRVVGERPTRENATYAPFPAIRSASIACVFPNRTARFLRTQRGWVGWGGVPVGGSPVKGAACASPRGGRLGARQRRVRRRRRGRCRCRGLGLRRVREERRPGPGSLRPAHGTLLSERPMWAELSKVKVRRGRTAAYRSAWFGMPLLAGPRVVRRDCAQAVAMGIFLL